MPARRQVLIVEDEVGIAESLAYLLEADFFATTHAETLKTARAVLATPLDLVILDLSLPDGNGLDLLREIRGRGTTPVIVLTSRSDEVDRIVGLELGADDYVTKPFSPREVVARVKAVLRRSSPPSLPTDTPPTGTLTTRGSLVIDEARRVITYASVSIELTKREFDLLAKLAARPGIVYTREQLLDGVWDDDAAVTDRAVDAHIKSLRRKLAEAGAPPGLIATVRGVGYRFGQ